MGEEGSCATPLRDSTPPRAHFDAAVGSPPPHERQVSETGKQPPRRSHSERSLVERFFPRLFVWTLRFVAFLFFFFCPRRSRSTCACLPACLLAWRVFLPSASVRRACVSVSERELAFGSPGLGGGPKMVPVTLSQGRIEELAKKKNRRNHEEMGCKSHSGTR